MPEPLAQRARATFGLVSSGLENHKTYKINKINRDLCPVVIATLFDASLAPLSLEKTYLSKNRNLIITSSTSSRNPLKTI